MACYVHSNNRVDCNIMHAEMFFSIKLTINRWIMMVIKFNPFK